MWHLIFRFFFDLFIFPGFPGDPAAIDDNGMPLISLNQYLLFAYVPVPLPACSQRHFIRLDHTLSVT